VDATSVGAMRALIPATPATTFLPWHFVGPDSSSCSVGPDSSSWSVGPDAAIVLLFVGPAFMLDVARRVLVSTGAVIGAALRLARGLGWFSG
jgi:hypothetical protein